MHRHRLGCLSGEAREHTLTLAEAAAKPIAVGRGVVQASFDR